ncbi:MAG: hypothetical protein ACJ797_23095 [Ktedonobacteraceae bacterium]
MDTSTSVEFFLGQSHTMKMSRACFAIGLKSAKVEMTSFERGSALIVHNIGYTILLVTLGYAIIFAVVAVVLTWRRDVKE